MKTPHNSGDHPQQPALVPQASQLATYLQSLSAEQIAKSMHISGALAVKTKQMLAEWTTSPKKQSLAIDSFIGDIYSGLQAATLSQDDRQYANQTLCILSGLYGILRPLDAICPYRLEMGYKLPDEPYRNLYKYWGDRIASTLPEQGSIINLTAIEYAKTVTPFVDASCVVTPKFMTINPKTGEPGFVVVHAKIARGAFAHWLIKNRAHDSTDLTAFNDLGYTYNKELSTPAEPVFVCKTFGGLGLSVRLK